MPIFPTSRVRAYPPLVPIAFVIVLAGCGGDSTPPRQFGSAAGSLGGLPSAQRATTAQQGAAPSNYHPRYEFGSPSDGSNPEATLIYANGTLYGTTFRGGTNGLGTVFSLTPAGAESVLHSFGALGDGENPVAGLCDVNGTLYGATYGSNDTAMAGVAFSLTTGGLENVLYHFGDGVTDGAAPDASLIRVSGLLYGTTYFGGSSGNGGTVYSITTAGVEKVLHAFKNTEGANPTAPLLNVNGTLYGTTLSQGAKGYGTVFTVSTAGVVKVLHNFASGTDGAEPAAGLINVNGTLYGTTEYGGNGFGTVFRITTAGAERTVYRFKGGTDGATPISGLTDVKGTLYGTTYGGGTSSSGTVYKVTVAGVETVLHSFENNGFDGANPYAGLLDVNGTLYGTTAFGGEFGGGTVFSLP